MEHTNFTVVEEGVVAGLEAEEEGSLSQCLTRGRIIVSFLRLNLCSPLETNDQRRFISSEARLLVI